MNCLQDAILAALDSPPGVVTTGIIRAAAKKYASLNPHLNRLVDVIDSMYDGRDLYIAEENEWNELLDAAIEVRAALSTTELAK